MKTLISLMVRLHKTLFWLVSAALLIFALSGMLHPIMTWTGPKAVKFFPPQGVFDSQQMHNIPLVLSEHDIDQALLVKVIPSEQTPLLQVTEHEYQPRRYFSLVNQREIIGHDEQQASWLASYYSGLPREDILSIEFQTEFDEAYSWVNRLLPVYKVRFKGDEGLVLYVYTETNALASIVDHQKVFFQTWFKWLHTWNGLDNIDFVRVAIITVLVLSLLVMALTGGYLLFRLPKRKIRDASRRWHRYIAHVLWIPLVLFTTSGLYHLFQNTLVEPEQGMRLGKVLQLDSASLRSLDLAVYEGKPLNAVSLIHTDALGFALRLSYPIGVHEKDVSQQDRFKGKPTELKAIYLGHSHSQKQVLDFRDEDYVREVAAQYMELSEQRIHSIDQVHRFGPEYDFRNKRLPVWRVDFDTPNHDTLFIDPATGMLVDRISDISRYERYSFSFLHKFNFLTPFMGRQQRDLVIVCLLVGFIVLMIFGCRVRFSRRLKKAKATDKKSDVKVSTGI